MAIKRLHIIRLFAFMLLLMGGAQNGAWAKVTYHILSLPINTKQLDGTDHQAGSLVDFRTNVRVEVLRVVSSDLHVSLPFEYKSPLATNYRYYSADYIAKTGPNQLYGYSNTTYYFYNIQYKSGESKVNTTYNANYGDNTTGDDNTPTAASVEDGVRLSPGAACADNIDIYVTYDVKASPDIDLSTTLNTSTGLLSTGKIYNIHLNDRMLVLNQNRQNRPGAVLDGFYTPEQLASNEFSWIVKEGLKNTAGWRHFTFKFGGNDPYNVTIYTAYDKATTFRGTGQADFYTKDVKEKDKYIQKDVFKEYRGASFFRLMSAEMNDKNMWLSSDADIQWQDGGSRDAGVRKVVPGYFKGPNDNKSNLYEMSPIFNSFAILNHKSGTGYAFAGSKMNTGTNNWQPRANGNIQYMDYGDSGNNITVVYKAEANVMKVDVYEVKKYIFRVVTPFDKNVDAEIEWSDYSKDETITISTVPESLKRKYTTITGFYADDDHNTAVSTFAEVQSKCGKDSDGKYIIYVDYSVNAMPFKTISAANEATAYTNATWYQITDKDSSGKKIKWDSTNSVFKNNGGATNYDKETHFAFIGDPYELHIINRALSESNSGNRYVGSTSRSSGSDLTYDDDADGDGYKWEIPYDAVTGNFTLREFKSSEEAYWKWVVVGEGNNITYTKIVAPATPTRIKVMELPKIDYVYHIVRSDGTIAVKAKASQDVGTQLDLGSIPEIIRSPFIGVTGATRTFYWTLADATAGTNSKTSAPVTIDDKNIYVRYDISSIDNAYKKFIDGTTEVNVRLNGQYLYYDSETGTVKSSAEIEDSNDDGNTDDETNYQWKLGGTDPYDMTVWNNAAAKYVTAIATDNTDLGWDADEEKATRFIIKSGTNLGVYEVMYATGDGTDASTDYFNIGRDGTGTKIFQNSTYPHGYDQLRFQLTPLDAHNVTYHLIDKQGIDLLQVVARHSGTEAPLFPNEYRSPLVAAYHYWILSNFDVAGSKYTLKSAQTELSTISTNTVVYVTYDTGDDYDLQKKRTMYLLKFNDGDSFKQEDGGDGLTAAPVKAVYPYCNGDGNFFVYGQDEYELQQQGAASTRTRWAWYLESANNDPYHVKICSRQQETYPAGSDNNSNAYFHTYAETFNGSKHVVTNLSWPGISGVEGTEYMVLGSVGQFRLLTTNAVNDDITNVRRTVNSFEQYWKTWNTIRLKVLGDEDAEAKQSDPNIVPATPAAPTAAAAGKDNRTYLTTNMGWHSYEQWAYAIRWNDYNKAGDKNKKGWESLEHWYQTVNMGEGYFDLVPITIDPVLILLDQHGWEIMRKALPNSPTDPDMDDKYNAIRPYDSPMVKEYYFWTKASKRSGFHQYYSLGQQIKVDDVAYTSTSLTDLPPFDATDVHDKKGNLLDQYVTYVVKDEYLKACDVSLSYEYGEEDPADEDKTYAKVTATVTGVPFLIQQGDHFAYNNSDATAIGKGVVPTTGGMSQYIISNISDLTVSGSKKNELWYLMPNLNIDQEMGYDVTGNPAHEWASDYDRKDKVKTSGFNSWAFDPYNIQISSVSNTSKYFVTNSTGATLGEGDWTGTYTGTAELSLDAAADPRKEATWYDSRTMAITNATFMAVQDESGNMQLMPRFDHSRRLKDFSTLVGVNDSEVKKTYTTLYRPLVYNYMIIDNDGNESLRYQGGGDLVPQTPEWFKSQLAKDFKYYFGHAAYSSTVSTEASYTAAATSDYFKKEALSAAAMETAAKELTVVDDYYFKINDGESYKKVTVTKAHTGSTDATYKITNCKEAEWTNAVAYTQSSANDAECESSAMELTIKGLYYFQIGPTDLYKKVTVSGETKTKEDSNYADWTNHKDGSQVTVDNMTAYNNAVATLSSNGIYYYKIESYYSYKKVVVTNTNDTFISDVATKSDISNREITEESSLAGAGLTTAGAGGNTVYVRYSYDEDADVDKVLQGKWLTMTLNEKDAVYSTGLKQASTSKPTPVNASYKTWQWKFLATPQSTPDPYAVSIYNRSQNGTVTTVSEKTKFALLNYYNAGTKDPNIYTFAVAGTQSYDYDFVNGASMTSDVAATIATEADVKGTSCSYDGTKAQVVLTDDVEHTYTYTIYTNGRVAAVSAEQDNATAVDNGYVPTLPDEIKSPLLNTDQFRYYEALTDTAANSGKKLNYLYGLYNDIVYVRYNGYDPLTTEYKVPNVKTVVDSKVARDNRSNDAALDISGDLIYNIIWYDDNIMKNGDGDAISKDPSHSLDGTAPYVWQFEGNDPYAIKIKHQSSGKYAVGSSDLAASATSTFMLLPASDSWQYGVLQVTGTSGDNAGKKLTDYGETLTADASTNPTKFIIFGLSTNNVIYHLVIAKTCPDKTVVPLPTDQYVDIPYSEKDEEGNWVEGYSPTDNKTKRIYGSTCRDLTSKKDDDEEKPAGSKYQLGETKSINSSNVTYCVDQGHITLGDSLKVPEALLRPNCKYFYYVGGIYTDNTCATPASSSDATPVTLDSKYKGLQVKYMGKDPDLLGKTVVINVEYQFDDGLPTNNGSDFVTNTNGTQWYTFETSGETPYLANFTYKDNYLRGKEGRIGHYTNEFLWSPVGDPYGFKMYNRYVYKNGGETTNVMTTASIAEDQNFVMGATASNAGRDIYELLPGYSDGYFKVQTLTVQGGTPYYVDNRLDEGHEGEMKLKTSTTTEWHFGLSDALLEPYYLGAGNVGGLTTTIKAGTEKTKSGKALYEEATTLMDKQKVVFDSDNIVDFAPGYYRIFNQPNSQGIKTPQYLSGYTHKTELTGDGVNTDGPIPMHFYEKEGVTTNFDILGSGFTSTTATRGQIPIDAPEYDPASIFYITSGSGSAPYTMQTQGLYVKDNKMTATSGEASTFYVVDIGGAVVLLHDGATPAERQYLHYKQSGNIYDVKFENGVTIADDDAAKWCMEPANKKGLWIETHSGGEEEVLTNLWYYSSYCVPFDLLIANKNEKDSLHSSNAYTCVAEWNSEPESPWDVNGLHPKPIGKYNTGTYKDNDYFVPAGTPVLFSTRRATEYIKATIPTTTPSTPITTIFSAKYLEQLLPDWDNTKRVYVFGPKMEGTITLNTSDGNISTTLSSLGNTNVGFHINANQNKESDLTPATWTRNNYYVLHNKIYYMDNASNGVSTPARGMTRSGIDFVPVFFDDQLVEPEEFGNEEKEEDELTERREYVGDGCVYDMQGRRVATEQQVLDGSWKQRVSPGIYIINGKKISVN